MRLNIPLTGQEELALVKEVLESGFLTQGPKAKLFEERVAELVGVPHSFAVSSATTGIHLALHAAGVVPGDEVIIPDFSFPATANAVIQQGAIPVFIDIDLATFNMDPVLLEQAITDKTKAIMPVHAFGLPADMDPINEIANKYGIPVIEDAACALAGTYKGRQAGSLGSAGVFSFHPRKVITTGEGGMITTADDAIAERVTVLRSHGSVRGEYFLEFVDAGYNYRLSDVHAAIGLAQFDKLEYIVSEKQQRAKQLSELLSDVEEVTVPYVPEFNTHTYQSYVVLLDESINRNRVIAETKSRDVETTLGTYSMHLQPYFQKRFGIPDSALPNATRAHNSALTLPLYPQLTDADLLTIKNVLKEALHLSRAS